MVPQAIPLLDIPLDCGEAVNKAAACLQDHGWQTVRSFDLQAARLAHQQCACPHHGTARCDCQMVVLLLYGPPDEPLTLIVHGHDHTSHFSLVASASQARWAEKLAALLREHFEYARV